jgi:hypothetical protein
MPRNGKTCHLEALIRRSHATLLPGIVGRNDGDHVDEARITNGTSDSYVPIVEGVKRSPENADAGSRHG